MDTQRIKDIKKLGFGLDTNTQLLWYKHGSWLIEQVEMVDQLQYMNNRLQKENEELQEELNKWIAEFMI